MSIYNILFILFSNLIIVANVNAQSKDTLLIILSNDFLERNASLVIGEQNLNSSNDSIFANDFFSIEINKNGDRDFYKYIFPDDSLKFRKGLSEVSISLLHFNKDSIPYIIDQNQRIANIKIDTNLNQYSLRKAMQENCTKYPIEVLHLEEQNIKKYNYLYLTRMSYDDFFLYKELWIQYEKIFVNIRPISNLNDFYEVRVNNFCTKPNYYFEPKLIKHIK